MDLEVAVVKGHEVVGVKQLDEVEAPCCKA
jgi:hypothetical protein